MGKYYKTKLNIKSKATLKLLKESAGIYRLYYNTGIDAQNYQVMIAGGMKPSNYFLSKSDLTKVMQLKRDSETFLKKSNRGLFTAAINSAYKAFEKTTAFYLSTDAYITDKRIRAPRYLSRKKGDFKFKVSGVKVFYDYVTIPSIGKLKLFEKGYLPQGKSYTNVTLSYDEKDWWISLEVSEPIPVLTDNDGKATFIDFTRKGELLIDGKIQDSVTDLESFKKLTIKRKKLDKKIKRQAAANMTKNLKGRPEVRTSRNMVKTRKAISRVNIKLDNLKKNFFKEQVHNVVRTKPNSINVPSALAMRRERGGLLTRKMREGSCITLFSMFKNLKNKGFRVITHGDLVDFYSALKSRV